MHDEIDFEIITTQMQKISTNIFKDQASGTPESKPVDGRAGDRPRLSLRWLPSVVRWYVDGKLIRGERSRTSRLSRSSSTSTCGRAAGRQPNGGPWGPNPGDPGGPNITDPTLLIAHTPAENKSYYFDVDYVKVERLATHLGDSGHNKLAGSAASEALDGAAGDDELDGGSGPAAVAGGEGNDTLKGGAGDDFRSDGGTGTNLMSGGTGADRVPHAATVRTRCATPWPAFTATRSLRLQRQRCGAHPGRRWSGRGDVVVTPGTGGSAILLTIGGTTFQMEGDQSDERLHDGGARHRRRAYTRC